MTNSIVDQIRSNWNSADLKARIIYPLMLLLGVISALFSISIYETEKESLLNELGLRGQAISQSLSAFASTAIQHNNEQVLSKYVKQLIGQNTSGQSGNSAHILHFVEFYKNNKPFLTINNDSVRAKIQPHTLKYFDSSILSPDDKNIIGSVRISLSTQQIDDHLAARIFQLTIASAFFVILSSILLSWLLDKIVIQPLELLANKIQILMSHRFNQKISTSSWDEIGGLFHNLNHLRVRMKKDQQDDLSNLEQHLDRATTNLNNIKVDNKSSTILVVDDDRLIQMYLEKLLLKNSMRAICASNGIKALKLILDTDIDLILLDLSMPGISGFDVLETLNTDNYHKNIPVIVVSSSLEKKSVIKALNSGAVDYVFKPFNNEELVARIKTHLNVSLREKELEHIISERITSLKNEMNQGTSD